MVAEIKDRIQIKHSIIDESFKDENIGSYELIIELSNRGIDYCVFDTVTKKHIAFESVDFDSFFEFDAFSGLMDILTSESKLLNRKYKRAIVSVHTNQKTIVPAVLYDDSCKKSYLKFNQHIEGDEFICADEISSMESFNIYAIPFAVKIKMESLYNNVHYRHPSSTFIQDAINQQINSDNRKTIVLIGRSSFDLLVLDGKRVLLFNAFNYITAEDYIYYLLFVMEQLQLHPEKTELILLGNVDKNSDIYTHTFKYVKNVKWGSRLSEYDANYKIQQLPAHSYFTLFSSNKHI